MLFLTGSNQNRESRCVSILHSIEVWDLLDALGRGSQAVLGGYDSLWRRPRTALPLVMGSEPLCRMTYRAVELRPVERL
jgi:hypothetical protein